MADDDKIKQTTFKDGGKVWDLQGMAKAMYDWLDGLVAGSSKYRGCKLASTLDPRDPDPAKFKSPPKWLSPELMMQAACVWNAGAAQDYLFKQGLIPLVRAKVNKSGTLAFQSGADVTVSTGRDGDAYFIKVRKVEGSPYQLSSSSTAVITAIGNDLAVPVLSAINDATWRGWKYTLLGVDLDALSAGPVDSAAYVHIFA